MLMPTLIWKTNEISEKFKQKDFQKFNKKIVDVIISIQPKVFLCIFRTKDKLMGIVKNTKDDTCFNANLSQEEIEYFKKIVWIKQDTNIKLDPNRFNPDK